MKPFNEIGGNFWLKPEQIELTCKNVPNLSFVENQKSVLYTSSGRGAIKLILHQQECKHRRVLLPYYTCDSVIKSFIDCGFKIYFYEINFDFSVKNDDLEQLVESVTPDIIFFQSYFGFDTLSATRQIYQKFRSKGIIIIEDITHSWLSSFNKNGADYYVASLRKWLEIPDGGVVISISDNLDINEDKFLEHDEIIRLFLKASALKNEYTKVLDVAIKDEFRKYFYEIEAILDNENRTCTMSDLSKGILTHTDFEGLKSSRRENFAGLASKLSDCKLIYKCFNDIPEEITPLYFPIFVKTDRDLLQKRLAANQIYAPIHWPIPKLLLASNAIGSSQLYTSLLSIPCDQRYSLTDMYKIVEEIARC